MKLRRVLLFIGLILVPAMPARAAQISLPLKTFVARDLPQPGAGACPTGCKHMRLTYNPDNARIYFEGGDYTVGDGFPESGRQEMYSYDVATDSWRLEQPFCVGPGQYQPKHPDEVTWAWDSQRHIFWMVPGYQGNSDGCPQTPAPVRGKMMTFDPATKLWTLPARSQPPDINTGAVRFGVYDPITDTIIRFTYTGCVGVTIYDIKTDVWTRVCFPAFNHDIGFEYTALDVPGRAIYVLDSQADKICRYDIDQRTLTVLAPLPTHAELGETHIAWDSANRIVFWMDGGGCGTPTPASAHAYHPDTNLWETLPLTQPQGYDPATNHLVYDPGQNVFVMMGCTSASATGKFFLYRYGNGTGAALDSIPPSRPTNLRPR